jgi:hypothetical protein
MLSRNLSFVIALLGVLPAAPGRRQGIARRGGQSSTSEVSDLKPTSTRANLL